ncbi:Iron-sulfur flavoprotein [Sporomusa ovata DSM 2662]|uniref:Iron-sulfur flavoprotein n=1 Tax=Sporomusa ovata TaxID=2378 RepID=A0A0U1L4B7_9FIRM|nr:NAD(P)H-dependent oxidoreductase [Sporomusa ovata]EQB25389.1 multimeric flavodoxin WrbA [Sporomusa ovata DSM 2662]CQR73953.1 Iron-sulfur flavoprotein [Sporomusa ovata]
MKKDIRIAGIISSPKFNGNTSTLVREALKGAEDEGAIITEIFLPQYRIEHCTGCFRCLAEGKCHIADDFETIRNVLCDTDGIILGSPTHAFTFNSIMKTLWDRLGFFEFLTCSVAGGKYVVGISAALGMGHKKAAKELASFATTGVFNRGYISGILGVGLGGKEVANNTTILKRARDLGRKIVRDIIRGEQYPLQNPYSRLIKYFILQPLFRKIILTDKEDKTKGVYSELKKKGLIK